MNILRSKLYEYELEKKRAETKKIEDSKLDIDFGSQIRSYVLQPYRMVKDLRTREEIGDVDRVLDGDLNLLIRAYLQLRRSEQARHKQAQWPEIALRPHRFQTRTCLYGRLPSCRSGKKSRSARSLDSLAIRSSMSRCRQSWSR